MAKDNGNPSLNSTAQVSVFFFSGNSEDILKEKKEPYTEFVYN